MKTTAFILATVLATLAPSVAMAEGCEALTEALVKGLTTPWHATVTSTLGGTTRTTEIITLAGKSYVKEQGGDWKTRMVPSTATEERIRKDWTTSTCTAVGSEPVAGETATIVLHHTKGEPGQARDTRFWLSLSGLVLKTEQTAPRAVVTTVYDYKNVSAPK
jgi:hypothetical protein